MSVTNEEWNDGNTEIFFESISGRKYYTQIGISIKGNKIKEKAGSKDLTWSIPGALNKSFTSLFYFDSLLQNKKTHILSVMSHLGRNISNLAKFFRLKFRKCTRFIRCYCDSVTCFSLPIRRLENIIFREHKEKIIPRIFDYNLSV